MSVDELVAEGDRFRVAFPAASARGVRAHLENGEGVKAEGPADLPARNGATRTAAAKAKKA